ncbi:hypothetical protein D039_0283B, partial [Vibrio parahaemolyticus EKP-028]
VVQIAPRGFSVHTHRS